MANEVTRSMLYSNFVYDEYTIRDKYEHYCISHNEEPKPNAEFEWFKKQKKIDYALMIAALSKLPWRYFAASGQSKHGRNIVKKGCVSHSLALIIEKLSDGMDAIEVIYEDGQIRFQGVHGDGCDTFHIWAVNENGAKVVLDAIVKGEKLSSNSQLADILAMESYKGYIMHKDIVK